jgi:hypothetical protein
VPTAFSVDDSVLVVSGIGDRDEPDVVLRSETVLGAAFVLPPVAFS